MKLLKVLALVLSVPLVYLWAQVVSTEYSASPGTSVYRANGQFGNELPIASGDTLNEVAARGYDGSNYSASDVVALRMVAAEAFTASAQGTTVQVRTTQTGSITPATVLTVGSNGLSLLTDAAPRTNLTPPSAGTLAWNSGDGELCVSSGTTASTWVQVSSPTAACSS